MLACQLADTPQLLYKKQKSIFPPQMGLNLLNLFKYVGGEWSL
jgi:hypothetical protein